MNTMSLTTTESPQKWVQRKQPDPKSRNEIEIESIKYDLTITELPPENTWDVYKPFNIRSKQWKPFIDNNFSKTPKPSKNQPKRISHLFLPKVFGSITVDYSKFGNFESKSNKPK